MKKIMQTSPAAAGSARRFSSTPLCDKVADVVRWLEDHKAAQVVSLDLAGRSGFTEALVIASAGSVRQAQSLADGVGQLCRERNYEYLRTEGHAAGQWILVDMNDMVVNIFLESTREMYNLKALWAQVSARRAAPSPSATSEPEGEQA